MADQTVFTQAQIALVDQARDSAAISARRAQEAAGLAVENNGGAAAVLAAVAARQAEIEETIADNIPEHEWDGTELTLRNPDGDWGLGVDLKGNNGWTPLFAVVVLGERNVVQVADWTGGNGTKPAIGLYLGEDGFVADPNDATDLRADFNTEIGTATQAVLDALIADKLNIADFDPTITGKAVATLPVSHLLGIDAGNNIVRAPFKIVSRVADLEAAIEAGGEILVVPGTYPFTTPSTYNLTADVVLRRANGAVFVADAAIGGQMFIVNGGGNYSFDLFGGRDDVSAVTNPGVGGDTGSVWDLNQLRRGSIQGVEFVAGALLTSGKGDTAIDAVNCGPLFINKNKFAGIYDSAVYITGGSSTGSSDDGGPTIVSENDFYQCNTGVVTKRKNKNLIVTGNTFRRCHVAVGSYEVGAGEKQPGDRLVIAANLFEDVVSAAIELRGGFGETVISGNSIIDFGYDLTDTIIASPAAIQLLGSRDCVVSGNLIKLRDRTKTANHVGVLIDNRTVDGTLYTASDNLITGNKFRDLGYAGYEGASVGANDFLNNSLQNVTTSHYFTNAASIWAGVVADGDYRAVVGSAEQLRLHATAAKFKPNASTKGITFCAAVTAQAIAFGTVNSGAQSSLVTVTIAGVIASDSVTVVPETGGITDPRITYWFRAVAGGVQIKVFNGTGTNIDFSVETFAITVLRVA